MPARKTAAKARVPFIQPKEYPPGDPLDWPVQFAKHVGPSRAALLAKLGIATIRDLLWHVPRDYVDWSHITPIASLAVGQEAVIDGEVTRIEGFGRRATVLLASVKDASGEGTIAWFHQGFLRDGLIKGMRIRAAGRVQLLRREERLALVCDAQSFVHVRPDQPLPALQPVYPSTQGIGQKGLRRVIWQAVQDHVHRVEEVLPEGIRAERGYPAASEALRVAHAPADAAALAPARERLAFEELLVFQLVHALRRREREAERTPFPLKIDGRLDARIRARFPFVLTGAQERAIERLRADLAGPAPMNRLLQGDVGSGKTVVALYACLAAVGDHAQAAIMAPTEILAEQHLRTVRRMLAGSKVRVEGLLGSMPPKEKTRVRAAIESGDVDLVVGTHALVEQGVRFHRLAVAVIDEQHRFGVLQRGDLVAKGLRPHVLTMTATPIPRTLSIALYGDLEVTVLDEMPPGRRPVKTLLRPSSHVRKAIPFIERELAAGRQAYFVYPLIDPSDTLPLKSATEMHRVLKTSAFRNRKVALLHGAMKPSEKDSAMEEFRSGRAQVLVSTVVIEVGVDVPNATVMVIEHAERYGLSQLHQLRGRIGRGAHDSWCLLFADARTEDARARLRVLAETTDGFKIAEEDLRLRGPGEFLGTRQHGLPQLRVADLARDVKLLGEARDVASRLVDADPELSSPDVAPLRRALALRYGDRITLARIG